MLTDNLAARAAKRQSSEQSRYLGRTFRSSLRGGPADLCRQRKSCGTTPCFTSKFASSDLLISTSKSSNKKYPISQRFMLEPRKRRNRGHKNSRHGCVQCKNRKVKVCQPVGLPPRQRALTWKNSVRREQAEMLDLRQARRAMRLRYPRLLI